MKTFILYNQPNEVKCVLAHYLSLEAAEKALCERVSSLLMIPDVYWHIITGENSVRMFGIKKTSIKDRHHVRFFTDSDFVEHFYIKYE